MARLDRHQIVREALVLLDAVGSAALTTRGLAARLGVEQPALYWHFRNKAALLAAMAHEAMEPHAQRTLPGPGDDWRAWFAANARSLRATLLAHRDGAILHASSRPRSDHQAVIAQKTAFLVASGLSAAEAASALLNVGRFTLGAVLEEQAERSVDGIERDAPAPDHAASFEAGLRTVIAGLQWSLENGAARLGDAEPAASRSG